MRRLSLVLSLCLLAAACGAESVSDATMPAPPAVVDQWLTAVENGDGGMVAEVVAQEPLAIVLALENDLSTEQTAVLISSGIPDEVAAIYWASFREGFSSFAGRPIGTLSVGGYEEFDSEGQRFAAVDVGGSAGTATKVFARQGENGEWTIDLIATLGPGFVSLMRRQYASLPADEYGRVMRTAFSDVVAPSLWAALAQGGFGESFARDALFLLDEIAQDTSG